MKHHSRNQSRAAVLLEVVFSIVLFAAAAGVIISGLTASTQAVIEVRAQAQATDLAVSLLSQIQMGQVPLASDGPTDYLPPLDDWTWQVQVLDLENPVPEAPMKRVVVTVASKSLGLTRSMGYLVASPSTDLTGAAAGGGS